MPSIPVWLTMATGPLEVVVTPQTVGSAGALTDGTAVTLTMDADDIDIEFSPTLENIKPSTTRQDNNVILSNATRITLNEVLKFTGSNKLAALAAAADYFKVSITRGAQAYLFYGVRGAGREGLRNGKSVYTQTYEMVSIGTANPTYT